MAASPPSNRSWPGICGSSSTPVPPRPVPVPAPTTSACPPRSVTPCRACCCIRCGRRSRTSAPDGRSRGYVAIISDELSRVAKNSPEVIEWTRMQGRSFGVIPIFATQEPEQLPEAVRRTMFSLSTVISYAQENSDVAAQIAKDFTGGATEGFEVVHPKEVMDLPRYMTLVRTVLDQQRMNVFTARIHP